MIPSQNVNYNIPSIICYNEAHFSLTQPLVTWCEYNCLLVAIK